MKTTQRRVAATALAVGIALAGASTADAAGATKNLRCFSDEGASCTVTKDGAHLVSGFNRGWGVCEREEAERKVAVRRRLHLLVDGHPQRGCATLQHPDRRERWRHDRGLRIP